MKMKINKRNIAEILFFMSVLCFCFAITLFSKYRFVLFFIPDHLEDLFWSFFINLSASFLILTLTLFFLDPILEKIKEERWKIDFQKEFKDDLKKFSNMSIAYLLAPFGKNLNKYFDTKAKNFEKETEKSIKLLIEDTKFDDLKKEIKNFLPKNWDHLSKNIFEIKNEIQDITNTYISILPKKLLTKFLILKVNFKNLDSVVNLFNSLKSINEELAKKEETHKRLLDIFYGDISKNIIEYLSHVSNFRDNLLNDNKK